MSHGPLPTPSGSSLEPVLRKLQDYRSAGRTTALRPALPFRVRTYERYHYVIRERDVANHACVLLTGFAVRSKMVANGKNQILSIHMKGEIVDLQNSLLNVADHSVQMLTSGRVAMYSAPRAPSPRLRAAGARSCTVGGHDGRCLDLS